MQDWYVHTANTAQPQIGTLSEFLTDYALNLWQISLEHQDMLEEEITEAEVEGAINEAHGISAQGPSVKTSHYTNSYSKRYWARHNKK
jgi:hypothetical protein